MDTLINWFLRVSKSRIMPSEGKSCIMKGTRKYFIVANTLTDTIGIDIWDLVGLFFFYFYLNHPVSKLLLVALKTFLCC